MLEHTTKDAPDLPANNPVTERLRQLFDRLEAAGQRQLLLLQGEREWCLARLPALGADTRLISNDESLERAVTFKHAENLLGGESCCAVYDGFSGLNIDVLCMAAGLVRAGGLLVMLVPPGWESRRDPYGSWQGRSCDERYFTRYLHASLASSDAAVIWSQSGAPPSLPELPLSKPAELHEGETREQTEALRAMREWILDPTVPVFLLTADRGRGKSTALGLFARDLPADGLLITAASRNQARVLLRVLGAGGADRFIAPDELIRQRRRIPCLLIDEAAMLSHSLLQQCVALADKVLMATTTGGYEGTGQGFLLRYMASFESAQYRHVQLQAPVRWGDRDVLERWLYTTLLLRSEVQAADSDSRKIAIQVVSRRRLSEEGMLLRDVYGLLVSAHYRTRPSDLRQLMEDPNQQLLVATAGNLVVGVMLLNREGGLSAGLSREIFLGKRRPPGHLFAQMITAQAAIRDFARHRGYRVQRITVHPVYRRQGIGSHLLQLAWRQVQVDELDYLSTSFALDTANGLFWREQRFVPVHIGSGRGRSTGRQTVALLRSNNAEITRVVQQLRTRVAQQLPVWLLTYCNGLAWSDVLVLLGMVDIRYPLSLSEFDEIEAFCEGFRGLELSQAVLQRLLISSLAQTGMLDDERRRVLIERILLNRPWDWLAATTSFSGRKQMVKAIREGVEVCYEAYRET